MGQKGRGWDREIPEGFEEYRKNGVRRCWAHAKNSGGQCTQPAATGQNVCRYHGAMAPQSLAKAQERVTEQKAAALVATYGLKIETTASEALLEEVQRTAGHVAWLGERVRELDPDSTGTGTDKHPLVWGVTKKKTGGEDFGTTEEAVPSVWLKLYQQEREMLRKVCAEAIKAGIEERRVKLAEQQGALVAQVIRAILDDLGLTVEQQAKVPEIVPRHLRALTAA